MFVKNHWLITEIVVYFTNRRTALCLYSDSNRHSCSEDVRSAESLVQRFDREVRALAIERGDILLTSRESSGDGYPLAAVTRTYYVTAPAGFDTTQASSLAVFDRCLGLLKPTLFGIRAKPTNDTEEVQEGRYRVVSEIDTISYRIRGHSGSSFCLLKQLPYKLCIIEAILAVANNFSPKGFQRF